MMLLFPGTSVQISCVVSGIPQPTVSWRRDNMTLVNGTGGVSIYNVWNMSQLTAADSMGQQGGDYDCTGTNIAGSISLMFIVQCKCFMCACACCLGV